MGDAANGFDASPFSTERPKADGSLGFKLLPSDLSLHKVRQVLPAQRQIGFISNGDRTIAGMSLSPLDVFQLVVACGRALKPARSGQKL